MRKSKTYSKDDRPSRRRTKDDYKDDSRAKSHQEDLYDSFKDEPARPVGPSKVFKFEFHKKAVGPQKVAWAALEQHDIIFLLGPAGTGKTFISIAYAIGQVLAKHKQKIILTRPIVEAGENLGFLPGGFDEKIDPYMMPLYDSITKLVGWQGPQCEYIHRSLEKAPLAYLRGRTLSDAICIFDEAQNATMSQLKLFLTRLGENSKMIITGDPTQSDLPGKVSLVDVVNKIQCISGISVVEFKASAIVRHPLVGSILEKLGE